MMVLLWMHGQHMMHIMQSSSACICCTLAALWKTLVTEKCVLAIGLTTLLPWPLRQGKEIDAEQRCAAACRPARCPGRMRWDPGLMWQDF